MTRFCGFKHTASRPTADVSCRFSRAMMWYMELMYCTTKCSSYDAKPFHLPTETIQKIQEFMKSWLTTLLCLRSELDSKTCSLRNAPIPLAKAIKGFLSSPGSSGWQGLCPSLYHPLKLARLALPRFAKQGELK